MSKYFTRTFHVGWNEINAIGQAGLSNYFQYVVETAWAWGSANGLGIAESEALGLAWVMHETEISIVRPLKVGDDFDFTIWLQEWRRVRGTRCFELRIKDGGELAAQGVQEIVVLDSTTLRPVSPPENLIENLRMQDARVVPRHAFPKVMIPDALAYATERVVEWRDLDWQEHVNNAIYPEYAEEAGAQLMAALGWPPAALKAAGCALINRRVHIQYLSSASWGERLNLTTAVVDLNSAGGTWYVDMQRQSDKERVARCVLEWAAIDRITGRPKALPEALERALHERLVAT